jgi:hypothetical protein
VTRRNSADGWCRSSFPKRGLVIVSIAASLAGCPPPPGPGYVDVKKIVVPATDPGRFDIFADGVTMIGGNLHNGDHTGAYPVGSGSHTLTEAPHPGTSTNLANYTITWGGDCSGSPDGTVVIPVGTTKQCTVTNTSTLTGNPPPPPQFSLPSGTGACPYSVTLSDNDPTALIFFTTDGTQPTQSSLQYTGLPLPVRASGTFTAVAINAFGMSSAVANTYTCGMFTSVSLTIQTGADDARSDSAIQAVLATNSGSTTWCLKYSDNGSFMTCSQQHPGITWQPLSTNTSNETLTAPVQVQGFNTFAIQLMSFPGFAKSVDNWDLQSLWLVGNVSGSSPGFPSAAQLLWLSGSTPPGTGTCFARFSTLTATLYQL